MKSVLRVQKYGGSSLSTPGKILAIAKSITQQVHKGERFLIIVSAMGDATDELFQMASKITPNPDRREMDMLLTAGERISVALFAMALIEQGTPAISFTGSQAGIITSGDHGDANILEVRPFRVVEEIKKGKVVVLAGFQGVDQKTKDVTTLGRGGSDTTAIAMASYFNCPFCEFMKDTEGVFDRDPKQHSDAKPLPHLTWQQVLHRAERGEPFLHEKAARLALEKKMPLILRHAHRPHGLFTRVESN